MRISLGTGIESGPRRAGPPPVRAGAPALVRAPALIGDGRIGAALAADPGDWTGALRFEFAWLKNGAEIAGAARPDYAPRPADDRAALACRVTAVGAAGRTAAETPAVAAAFPPPQPAAAALPALVFPQGTGFHIMDASPFFSGAALAFSISGDGVSIDPETGLMTISLDAVRDGAAIRLVAENSGGRAELGFTLKVTPAAVAPVLTRAPALSGSGRVGEALTLDPGAWAGAPAPDLALQWLCDGAEIAGATGEAYTPGAAEDGTAVAVRVTARNAAGALAAETAAVAIVRTPPAKVRDLADVVLAQGAAAAAVPAAAAFAGDALRFTVAGGGASIDPATGDLTLPTAAARAGETVTVTATNSGGAATAEFALRVLAAPAVSGALAPAVFAVGSAATVAAGAAFSGDALVFALDAGPEGATIDPATGLVTIPTGAALEGAATVRATNAVGAATARFAVRVLAAPRLTGALADVAATIGDAVRVDVGAVVAGTDLVFAVDRPWEIDAAGVLIVPTAAPFDGSAAVTATDPLAQAVTARFRVGVRAPALVLTGVAPDVAATVGEARTVDVGALVTPKTGLTWTTDHAGWAVSAAGVLTIPTAAALPAAAVSVTASDAFGQSVTATFRVSVAAPALILATAPTLAAATLPGTALGSVWTIAGGVFAGGTAPFVTERRFLRDGAQIAAFGAATAYTIVAADQGKTITAQVRRTDSSVPPQVLTVDAAGSAAIPAAVPAMTVTTTPAFTAAAAPGTALGSVWTIAGGVFAGGTAPFVTERRFLRDGAQIAAFGAATAYTIVAADQGRTITAQVRRTDSSVPPQVLTVDLAGAAVIPAAIPPLTVTTAPTLTAAVAPGTALGSVWTIAGGVFAGGTAPFVTERRFLRDGAQIAAFGAATAYTIVAADQGRTITAQVRRTDSSVPPQVLTVDLAGAAVIPAAIPPLTVTTAPTLTAAAAPGTALGSVWTIAGGVFAGGVAPIVTERRFLRDGTAIAAYGAATAYTVVAADQGKTITAQVRRTDSAVPPQVLTVDATGAAVIPAAADFTVNTTAQLLAAMVTAAGQAGPKVIACNPGNYAALTRTNALVKVGKAANGANLNNRVTVISANRNNPATWRDASWSLQNLDGFTFDGLRFLGTTDDGLGFARLGVQAVNCQDLANVTFRNCAWDGWCDNLAVTRSVNLTIEWNDMKGAGRDSVRLFDRHQNLLVQNNDFDGFRADGSPGVDYTRSQSDDPNRHADFLSIQISTVAARGGIGIRVLNNRFRSGNGYHQGFFCANSMLQTSTTTDFDTYKTTGLVCAGNWFEMCHVNCLYISGCEDFVCQNNLVRRIAAPNGGFWDATALGQPTLVLAGLSTGAVTDVVSHRAIKLDGRMPNLNGVAVQNYVVDAAGTARPADLPAPPPVGAYGYE